MIIDAFTSWETAGEQAYDKDGKLAAQRIVDKRWLKLMAHSSFKLSPPKGTGREQFGIADANKLWHEMKNLRNIDKIATVTEVTVTSIAFEINKHV